MRAGVILYGPPVEDTITAALRELDHRFALFPRVKAGAGRTDGYRMVSHEHFDELREQGEIIWENRRYGSVYGVEKSLLLSLADRSVPVLHLGQPAAIGAVREATPSIRWVVVSLWCPRRIAAARIVARKTGDAGDRLTAWDETEPLPSADMEFDTAAAEPAAIARTIRAWLQEGGADSQQRI
ncbi:kinase [Micromonospora echinofusca]|uniref:kinase n=1 Tax=Micromonospora echinofusca TaxID=47858 RepID=UPI001AD6F828|nr:kinase [Micromonospora echinofusca]